LVYLKAKEINKLTNRIFLNGHDWLGSPDRSQVAEKN